MELTQEREFEAELYRVRGELLLAVGDRAAAEESFGAALDAAQRQSAKLLGTPRRDEHGAALARPGQAAASSRTARSGLRVVY